VALQGSLETFAVSDVLRLLASTHKTGVVHVRGDQAQCALAIIEGEFAPGVDEVAVFDALRIEVGSFSFEGRDALDLWDGSEETSDVEALLTGAELLVAEWREITAVIPSLSTYLRLAAELPDTEVTIDAPTWAAIAAIAGGATAGQVADRLGLDELDGGRRLRTVVERGFAEVAVAPIDAETVVQQVAVSSSLSVDHVVEAEPPVFEPIVVEESVPAFEAPAFEAEVVDETEPAVFESIAVDETPAPFADEPAAAWSVAEVPVESSPVEEPVEVVEEWRERSFHEIDIPGLPPLAGSGAEAEVQHSGPVEEPQGEISLGDLTPQAVRAIAAAARATSERERDAYIAEAIAANDAPLSRTMLLSFLESVKS
jgi:hypothetical protein